MWGSLNPCGDGSPTRPAELSSDRISWFVKRRAHQRARGQNNWALQFSEKVEFIETAAEAFSCFQ